MHGQPVPVGEQTAAESSSVPFGIGINRLPCGGAIMFADSVRDDRSRQVEDIVSGVSGAADIAPGLRRLMIAPNKAIEAGLRHPPEGGNARSGEGGLLFLEQIIYLGTIGLEAFLGKGPFG